MIPIPQYPLYTATIAEFNAYAVSYRIASVSSSLLEFLLSRVNYPDAFRTFSTMRLATAMAVTTGVTGWRE